MLTLVTLMAMGLDEVKADGLPDWMGVGGPESEDDVDPSRFFLSSATNHLKFVMETRQKKRKGKIANWSKKISPDSLGCFFLSW